MRERKIRNTFSVRLTAGRKGNAEGKPKAMPGRTVNLTGLFYSLKKVFSMTDLDMTATDPNVTHYDQLAENRYQIEEDEGGLILRLYANNMRKNAFIRPDRDLMKEKGIGFYTRLNMPDEDRAKLMKWLGISELKHT